MNTYTVVGRPENFHPCCSGVAEQAFNIARREARDTVDVAIVERAAEVVALPICASSIPLTSHTASHTPHPPLLHSFPSLPQPRPCAPKIQASNVKLAKASTVLLMMMRVTRPLSAP